MLSTVIRPTAFEKHCEHWKMGSAIGFFFPYIYFMRRHAGRMAKAVCIGLFQFIRCHAKLSGPCMGCIAYGKPSPVIVWQQNIFTVSRYNDAVSPIWSVCLSPFCGIAMIVFLYACCGFCFYIFLKEIGVTWAIEHDLLGYYTVCYSACGCLLGHKWTLAKCKYK